MEVGFDIEQTTDAGRVLDMTYREAGLTWSAFIDRAIVFERGVDVRREVRSLFADDVGWNLNVCLCMKGSIDVHSARMRDALESLAVSAWLDDPSSVRELLFLPMFDHDERLGDTMHDPMIAGVMGDLCARLLARVTAMGLTGRGFCFYHASDGEVGPHFHILCIDA